MTERRPVTLITGASAGIGLALAWTFAENGHELLLVARREQRLAELADEIAAAGHRRPAYVAADLGQSNAVEQLAATMAELGIEPDNIVNNAGFGLLGPAATLSLTEQLAMIDLNARTLTHLSLAFIDSLERHRGGVLNVASMAAYLPGPNMAVYYATKAYVLSFSEALHWELRPRGIRVNALCPGPVPTEFQERAGFTGKSSPETLLQSAKAVAEAAYRALRRGQRVVVPGLANNIAVSMMRFVPRPLLSAIVGRYNRARLKKR